jgi:hypothetical protein
MLLVLPTMPVTLEGCRPLRRSSVTTVDRVKAETDALGRIGGAGDLECWGGSLTRVRCTGKDEMRQMELFAAHIILASR